MGWDKGRYYTRSRREGGRVVREYIGRGEIACLMARLDKDLREKESEERLAALAEQEKVLDLESLLDDLDKACTLVMQAELEAAGFHQHDRGEWRKRRA